MDDVEAFVMLFLVDSLALAATTTAILSIEAGQLTAPLPLAVVAMGGVLAWVHHRRDVHTRLIAWWTGTAAGDSTEGYKYG